MCFQSIKKYLLNLYCVLGTDLNIGDTLVRKQNISLYSQISLCCSSLVTKSCLTLTQLHGLHPTRLLCPWDFPGKNTGVGYHFLLQRVFLTQGWNPHLLLGRQILYHLRTGRKAICKSTHRCYIMSDSDVVIAQSLSCVWLLVTPWTVAHQASRPLLSPGVCPRSCLLNRWCYPTISSSTTLFFFCLQSFPGSGCFLVSWLFTSGGKSRGQNLRVISSIHPLSHVWLCNPMDCSMPGFPIYHQPMVMSDLT